MFQSDFTLIKYTVFRFIASSNGQNASLECTWRDNLFGCRAEFSPLPSYSTVQLPDRSDQVGREKWRLWREKLGHAPSLSFI